MEKEDLAFGEAIVASHLVGPLLSLLVKKNVLTHQEIVEMIDLVLHRLEQNRGQSPSGNVAPIDYARSRLLALLELHSKKTANPHRPPD